jgi:hypothetical protein
MCPRDLQTLHSYGVPPSIRGASSIRSIAPKARPITAQGNALGERQDTIGRALKARPAR